MKPEELVRQKYILDCSIIINYNRQNGARSKTNRFKKRFRSAYTDIVIWRNKEEKAKRIIHKKYKSFDKSKFTNFRLLLNETIDIREKNHNSLTE